MNSSAFFTSTIKTHVSSCCVHTKTITMVQNKEHYNPPRVKVVSFCVEEGYQASMASFNAGLLERLSSSGAYDGSAFSTVFGGSSAIGGGLEGIGAYGSVDGSGFFSGGGSGGGGGSTEGLNNYGTYNGGFF